MRHSVLNPDVTIDLGQFATFPAGYHPANPSIVRYDDGFLVCVRGVAYSIDQELSIHGNAEHLPSLNRLFVLNNDLTYRGPVPLPPEKLDNIDDLKLFSGLGRIWAAGSSPIDAHGAAKASIMTLVEFDPGVSDCHLVRIASPLGFSLEKNWAPFFARGALHFIYSCEPTLLVRYEPATGSVSFVQPGQPERDSLRFLEGGSSAGIDTPSGMIFLTHRRVVRLPSKRRIYLSRIRRLSENLTTLTAGPFFSIGRPTIQFANGMLLDRDRAVISYGEMDATARLGCFSTSWFERAAFPAS